MTKDQVKTLCEADDKLQWWAMVLFAEICELEQLLDAGDKSAAAVAAMKIQEFPQLVVRRQLEQAEGKLSRLDALEQRVKALEEKLG